ncbi:hypothetical protein [Thalassiella azotivora]
MPRSNRPRRAGRAPRAGGERRWAPEPLDVDRALGGSARRESGPDGDWMVRRVAGTSTTKHYRCPGCDQEVAPGTPHVVAWPADSLTGPDTAVGDRRHWHTACWSARTRRSARTPRPGRGPRY